MYKNKRVIAMIPAKGRSSFPGKNLKTIIGKPLIYYSIEPAKSKFVDDIFVITDNKEIEDISVLYGAKVIHLPESLTLFGANAALRYACKKIDFEIAIYLQPTDLFKNTSWIEECIALLDKSNYSSVFIGSEEHKNFWLEQNVPIRGPNEYYVDRQVKKNIIREDTGLGCAINREVLESEEFDVNDMRARLGSSPGIICKSYKFFDIHDEIDLFLAEKYLEKISA